MFKSFKKTPEIEFLCHKDDWDVIPEPIPANHLIPDWFKALPMKLAPQGMNSSTVKRCNPFLDAMNAGWIIRSAADVELHSNGDCSEVRCESSFYKPIVQDHGFAQVTHPKCPNPSMPKKPLKFLNYWITKPSPGYSILFMPPLNRPDPRFTFFSGFVDCDNYFEYVNFPFTFNVPNFSGIIPQGTPLVQMIPIKRDAIIQKSDVRVMDEADDAALALTRRKRSAHESVYRDTIVEKK
jgi:hypothetical protein